MIDPAWMIDPPWMIDPAWMIEVRTQRLGHAL
jgi:hypothetical protein